MSGRSLYRASLVFRVSGSGRVLGLGFCFRGYFGWTVCMVTIAIIVQFKKNQGLSMDGWRRK